MLCQVLHDVHIVRLMAGTHHGLALLPSRTVLLCVSVVTRCCEDREQMEVNCSWSVQYHASGNTTLQFYIVSHSSNVSCQVRMWVVCRVSNSRRSSRRATRSKVTHWPQTQTYVVLHSGLLITYNLPLLKGNFFAIIFHCKYLEINNAIPHLLAARIRKTTQYNKMCQELLLF